MKQFNKNPNQLGYRTPDRFKSNIRHKIVKKEIYDKIKLYAKNQRLHD